MGETEFNLASMIKIVNEYMAENGITHDSSFTLYATHCAKLQLPFVNTVTPTGAFSLLLQQRHVTY
jgi:hypothetical protein